MTMPPRTEEAVMSRQSPQHPRDPAATPFVSVEALIEELGNASSDPAEMIDVALGYTAVVPTLLDDTILLAVGLTWSDLSTAHDIVQPTYRDLLEFEEQWRSDPTTRGFLLRLRARLTGDVAADQKRLASAGLFLLLRDSFPHLGVKEGLKALQSGQDHVR
jgi:hypothetical protein